MKRILAFLLAATMLSAMLVLPSAAADNVNYEVNFKYVGTAPIQDGVVRSGEYGASPIHTFSQSKSQFVFNKGHTKYTKWDFDFYAAWDENNLYLAWVVRSDIHGPVPKAQLGDQGEVIGTDYEGNKEDTLQKMWMYSCVQFVITPGNPTVSDYETYRNYLEAGICEMDDGTTGRAVWSIPVGLSSSDVSINSWSATAKRNDADKTTTYEISIPWEMTGLNAAGFNKPFGLAYVVSTQEQYYSKTPAMIEWQNVMLTGTSRKLANNCAVVTLKDNYTPVPGPGPYYKVLGVQPDYVASKDQLVIDGVNRRITGNDAVIFTSAKDAIAKGGSGDGNYNLTWTYNMLLKPTGNANEYEVVAAEQSIGEKPSFTNINVTNDMILVALHSDGTPGTYHDNRRFLAIEMGCGTILKSWEINLSGSNPDTKYLNSCLYVEKTVQFVDPYADIFGYATKGSTAQYDGDISFYEAEDEELVISSAKLRNTYALIFDEDGKLTNVGAFITSSVTLSPGYKALTFIYSEEKPSNLALKYLYDDAIENFVSEDVADNGMRTVDEDLGCPFAIYYDEVIEGVIEFWIPKTSQDTEYPDVEVKILCGEGGKISPSRKFYLKYGKNTSFTITPDEGYCISALYVNGIEVEDAEGVVGTYRLKLENLRRDTLVEVEFEEKEIEAESSTEDSDASANISDKSDDYNDDDDDDYKSSRKKKNGNLDLIWWILIISGAVLFIAAAVIICIMIVIKARNNKNQQ